MGSQAIVIGVVTGIIANLVVGWPFFYFGGRQLRREARDLQKLNLLLLRGLHNAGLIHVNFDADGNPRGLSVTLSGTMDAVAAMTGNPTVRSPGGVVLQGAARHELAHLEQARTQTTAE
jgi:hypothetical protein